MNWKTWIPSIVAFVVMLVVVVSWNNERSARTRAERAVEAAALEAQGVAVAHESTVRGLKASLAQMVVEHGDLAAELERLRHASPGAKPTAVVHGSTGPVVVPPVLPPQVPSGPACPQVPAAPECLLRPGDSGEVVVAGATLETRAGNIVAVGVGEAWRVDPAPRTKLFGGPLKLDLAVAPTRPPPRWGAGVGVWGGRWGWAAGPVLALPPAHLWIVQAEVTIGAGVGSGGEWSGGATTVLRW